VLLLWDKLSVTAYEIKHFELEAISEVTTGKVRWSISHEETKDTER
jgi:hypothetical protein